MEKFSLEQKPKSTEIKYIKNVMVNGENIVEYKSLKGLYDQKGEQMKDFIFTLVQYYGEDVERIITDKREELFDFWYRRLYEGDDQKYHDQSWVEGLRLGFIETGDFDGLIEQIREKVWAQSNTNHPDSNKEAYEESFGRMIDDISGEKIPGMGLDTDTFLLYSKGLEAITRIYRDVLITEDENLDYANTIGMIAGLYLGLKYYHNLTGETKKFGDILLNIDKGEENGVKSSIKTDRDMVANMNLFIKRLIYDQRSAKSLRAKLEKHGATSSVDEEESVRFNAKASKVETSGLPLTDGERIIVKYSNYSNVGGYVRYRTKFRYIIEMQDEKVLASTVAEFIKKSYEQIWSREQIENDLKYLNPKDKKKYRKKIADKYREYGQEFEDFIYNKPVEDEVETSEDVVTQEIEVPQNIDQEERYEYKFVPYTPPLREPVETDTKVDKLQLKVLKNHGNWEKLMGLGLPKSQLNYVGQILDYISDYKADGSDINRLNKNLSFYIKHYGGEILRRPTNSQKELRIGKIYKNAIKINLNKGDRMVVYTEGREVKVDFLTGAEYHDRLGKVN